MNKRVDELLKNSIVVDMHSDIPMHVYMRRKNGERKVIENNYLRDIKDGNVNVLVCAIFIMEDELKNPLEEGLLQLMAFREDIYESNDKIMLCTNYKDVESAVAQDKLAMMLSFEGLEPIGTKKGLLKVFYELGIRFNGLVWSRTNQISDGCGFEKTEKETKHGLSEYGREIVKYAEEIGMITDVTHLSEKGFWDTLNISQKPIIASHTNAQGINGIMRNFTDEQIRAIAQRNGVIGINGVGNIVADLGNKKIDLMAAYIDHIDYIKDLIGIDHIGIGLDLFQYFFNHDCYKMPDSFGNIPPDTLKSYSWMPLLVNELINHGYGDFEIKKIVGGNFMRILKTI